MLIHSMTATFGGLKNETLTLSPGLNVLTLPNEAGKSTWAAFLTAMLYGVDTAERSTKTTLGMKDRYQPWDGTPMAGRMEFCWQGRELVMERSSTRRGPMRSVLVYDRATGQTVPELCTDDVGQRLLGVERAVFQRSACIRQGQLRVTEAPELERRLAALVTGENEESAALAKKRLADWAKARSERKDGPLDRLQTQRDGIYHQLLEQERLFDETAEKLKQVEAAQETADHWQGVLQDLDVLEQARLAETCRNARQEAERTAAEARLLAVDDLPDTETLEVLLERARAMTPPEAAAPAPQRPQTPPPFEGLDGAQVIRQAQRDGAKAKDLLTPPGRALGILGGALTVLGLLCAALGLLYIPLLDARLEANPIAATALLLTLGAALLAAGVVLLLTAGRNRRRYQENCAKAQALLAGYGAQTPEELPALALTYGAALAAWEQARMQTEEQSARRTRQQSDLEELLRYVNRFAPVDDLTQCREALTRALNRRRVWEMAQSRAEQAEQAWQRLSAVMPEDLPEPLPLAPDCTRAQAEQASAEAQEELTNLREQYAVLYARLLSLDELVALKNSMEALDAQIETLRREGAAIALAQSCLEQADNALRTRFAPALARQAGEMLCQLTDGAYSDLRLDKTMLPSVRGPEDTVSHTALFLSGGTADQLYLAVRLALCKLILPNEAPILLDDALVNFDDHRLQLALQVLQTEAGTRQVLLLTCQDRESRALAALAGEKSALHE